MNDAVNYNRPADGSVYVTEFDDGGPGPMPSPMGNVRIAMLSTAAPSYVEIAGADQHVVFELDFARGRHWSAALIGLPWPVRGRSYDGVDCWGLAWLAWQANGIAAPSYAENYVCDREAADIDALIADRAAIDPWREIAKGEAQALDLLVFRCTGCASHVGIVVGQGMMLHITEGTESRIESYRRGRWQARLSAVYRFVA